MKHEDAYKSLKAAKAQLDAVLKMTEDDRYCIEISNQIAATISLLRKAQKTVLSDHLKSCMVNSVQKGKVEDVVAEIDKILQRVLL